MSKNKIAVVARQFGAQDLWALLVLACHLLPLMAWAWGWGWASAELLVASLALPLEAWTISLTAKGRSGRRFGLQACLVVVTAIDTVAVAAFLSHPVLRK